jgi:REP element-mobilizing transposase RayT
MKNIVYGFWLPNDPRGSWSDFVGSWNLFRLGKATKTEERTSVAYADHDHRKRQQAKLNLKFPTVYFSKSQIYAVAQGINQARQEADYGIYACAILPDHVHLIVGRHDREVERIIPHLKAKATQVLVKNNLWPEKEQPVWAKGWWKVFLNKSEEMSHAIEYVEKNPEKEGMEPQHWPFVVPYQ